jgi:hypothetical protein
MNETEIAMARNAFDRLQPALGRAMNAHIMAMASLSPTDHRAARDCFAWLVDQCRLLAAIHEDAGQ